MRAPVEKCVAPEGPGLRFEVSLVLEDMCAEQVFFCFLAG